MSEHQPSNVLARFVIVALVALPAITIPACTATAEPPATPTSFEVEIFGSGPPVLLIPGLSCDGSVWHGTVRALEGHYTLHVVSIAGFAGRPAIDGPFLPTVREGLLAYIEEQKLDRPAIVGHSLGGFMAFWLAATAPDAIGPIVAVDGVPYLAALQNPAATAESVRPAAEQMRAMMTSLDSEQFALQNRMTITTMVRDADAVDTLAARTGRSDPKAVAQAMYELMTTDLRETIGAITSPVLLIAATGGLDASMQGWAEERYTAQIARVPHAELVVAEQARHFVMLDEPTFLHQTLARFLGEAGTNNSHRTETAR